MRKISDPPGTRLNAQGRLVDEKTGKYTKDPTKVSTSTTRRASGKRSASASTPRDERSRSPEQFCVQRIVVFLNLCVPNLLLVMLDIGCPERILWMISQKPLSEFENEKKTPENGTKIDWFLVCKSLLPATGLEEALAYKPDHSVVQLPVDLKKGSQGFRGKPDYCQPLPGSKG
eukprot:6304181-Amphidinium_carterae.1